MSIVPTLSDSSEAPDTLIDVDGENNAEEEELRNTERLEQSKLFKLYALQDRREARARKKKSKKDSDIEIRDINDEQINYFDMLPTEIFTIIFSLCPPYEMLRMRRVCKLWKEMADNDSLWISYFRLYVDPRYRIPSDGTILKPWRDIYLEHIFNESKEANPEEIKRIEKIRQRNIKRSFQFNLSFVSVMILIILTGMIIDPRWRTNSIAVAMGVSIFLVGCSSEYPSQKKIHFPQFPILWMIGWIIAGVFAILLGLMINDSLNQRSTVILLARASIAFWFILFLFDRWRSRFRIRFSKFGGFLSMIRLFGALASFSFHTRDLESIFRDSGQLNPISSFDIPIYIFALVDCTMSSIGFIYSAVKRRRNGLPIFTLKRFNKYLFFSAMIAFYAIFVLLLVEAFANRVPLFVIITPVFSTEIFYITYRIIVLHKFLNGDWMKHLKHTTCFGNRRLFAV